LSGARIDTTSSAGERVRAREEEISRWVPTDEATIRVRLIRFKSLHQRIRRKTRKLVPRLAKLIKRIDAARAALPHPGEKS